MFKRISHLSYFLIAFLGLSLALAACGDNPTATSDVKPNAAPAQIPTGVKSAMAGSYPASTVLYLTLNTDTNSGQIKGWQKMIDYLNQIPEVKNVTQNLDLLSLAKIGTYDGDIKPWIGSELAIGISDLKPITDLAGGTNATAALTGELPILIGAPVTDQAKAEAFITKVSAKLKELGVPEPKKETYKDATLYTFNYFVTIVAGVSKDKFFIGGGPNLVKNAFDQTSDKSLAGNSSYKTVTSKLPTGNLGFVYADAPAITKALTDLPQAKEISGSLQSLQLDYTGPVGATFSITDEGLRVDTYGIYLPDKMPVAVSDTLKKGATSNKILSALPENTFFFANSRDAVTSYDTFLKTLKATASIPAQKKSEDGSKMTPPSVNDIEDGLAQFEKETGLNVRNDIVSLLSGEFAIFVTPSATPKNLPVGIGLVAEAGDKTAAQAKLDKIQKAAESAGKGDVKWETKTIGSTSFKTANFKDGDKQISLSLGIAGNYTFVTVGDDTTANFVAAATGGKNFTNGANAANFNKVRDVLPKDNTGYVYADVQAIVNYAVANAPAEEVSKIKNVTDKLTKLNAFGVATKQSTTETATTVYIYFPVTK